jgi:protein-disulfide isomerase
VVFAALAAAYLLFIQFSVSTFCTYCMTVDFWTIVLLSVVLMRVRTEADSDSWRASAWVTGVFALSASIPLLANVLIRPHVPDLINEEMKKTPHGQVTIVDFVDFECPYCRQTAADFAPTLAKYRGKFRFVRKEMPLTMHTHALAAAHAEWCAESMGQGDAMADKLMAAPVDDLTDDGCAAIAATLGLNEPTFRTCVSDPKTQQRIDADGADFKAVHGHGLPLIWINDQLVDGAQGPDRLREAMDKAFAEVGG